MDQQEFIDRFYFERGPCCAGCDWWRSHNSTYGECRRARIVSGRERGDVLGISNCSMHVPAGHPITKRDHHCGEFKDSFDWASLPMGYRKRIGAPMPKQPHT